MILRRFEVDSWIRPGVRALKPYESARDVVKTGVMLDANENPFPRKYSGIDINRYPDPNQLELRNAIASYVGLGAENVLAGSGSDEVLDWIFKVFCEPGIDRVGIAEPTYGMYTVMADIFGVAVKEFSLDRDFQLNSDTFLKTVPEDVKLLFLCSPNNPTGNLLDEEAILELASSWRKPVIVDEAYIEFSSRPSLSRQIEQFQNLIVMRTFSKAFGCAGLRLGYVLAIPEVIDFFLKVKAPYNLNSVTKEEGVRALGGVDSTADEVLRIIEERSRVFESLKSIHGVENFYSSEANFLLFSCRDASKVCSKLFSQGIVVRDRSAVPGLQDCIRVTIGAPNENARFLRSLEEILRGGST
jgi:histidinol-phosphate aminotransferase